MKPIPVPVVLQVSEENNALPDGAEVYEVVENMAEVVYEESEDPLEMNQSTSESQHTHGGHRISMEMWNSKNSEILVRAVQAHYHRLTGNDEKRIVVWRDIYKSICHEIPDITLSQCQVKWKNLKYAFCRYEQNRRRCGSAKIRKPPVFDLMYSFVTDNRKAYAYGEQYEFPGKLGHSSEKEQQDESDQGNSRIGSSIYSELTPDILPTTSIGSSTKKRRVVPSSYPEGTENIQREILEEIRNSGRKIEVMMEELAEQQKVMIANQRELLKIERRRNELLEEKLREEQILTITFADNLMASDDFDFFHHVRMKKETFEDVFKIVEPHYKAVYHGGNYPLTCRDALLITLKYLGSKATFKEIAAQFSVVEATIHGCTKKIIETLANGAGDHVKWPDSEDIPTVEKDFRTLANFPGVLGVLGGCRVLIKAPAAVQHDYLDKNNKHSVNLLAVCDASRKFTFVHAGFPGSQHASSVFEATSFYATLHKDPGFYFPSPNFHIIGDSVYQSDKHVLAPYDDFGILPPQHTRFNAKLRKTRVVIDQSFALLRARFQRLKYICAKIDRIKLIIIACCVLHNVAMNHTNEENLLYMEGSVEEVSVPVISGIVDGFDISVDLNDFELSANIGALEKRDFIASLM